MKISEMNREELKSHMISNGTILRAKGSSPEWKRAFDLYAFDLGERLDMSCPKCYGKVREYMEK